jgi:hypothetical protein
MYRDGGFLFLFLGDDCETDTDACADSPCALGDQKKKKKINNLNFSITIIIFF